MVEKSENMKCVEGKKYFNIVFDDNKAELEEKVDCLVIFNDSIESLHAENPLDEIEVTKENLEQFSENCDKLLEERKSENKSDPPIELLGDGLMNRKSVDLSCKSNYAQRAEQLEVRFDENERRSLIISELKSGNTSPVIEGETHERESPASGRSSKEATRVKSIETCPSVSESRNSTCPSSPRNNNPQKKSRENKSEGDICTESGLKAHVLQTAKRSKNPKRFSGSTSYEDSDESVVSIAKIQSDKEPCSSDLGLSSLYSTIGTTTEGTVSSAPYSDESVFTVLDPGLSISTNTYDIGSGNSRGRVPRPKARPDILVIDHPQQESGRNRVPVFLRAEAVLQNGELEVVVKDERNSCPNNVNIKVMVLHGPAKKRTSSKFSAYKVVPRLPRAPIVDRDIVKHRAMRPPFNTHVNPEAAERHRRHFGLE